jgi:hypothetical protein
VEESGRDAAISKRSVCHAVLWLSPSPSNSDIFDESLSLSLFDILDVGFGFFCDKGILLGSSNVDVDVQLLALGSHRRSRSQ